jgi:3',5'-cyclic AMP phosphodiesterase CpdA
MKIRFLTFCLIFLSGIFNTSGAMAASAGADTSSFTFIFMTDIHIEPQQKAPQGFLKAINLANSMNPDFVLTGGDLVMDALGQPFGKADSLYKLYTELSKNIKAPLHNTIGNHEHFGVYTESKVSTKHPDYGSKMFERYFGKTYYSYNHKGWHFIVLNSVGITPQRGYIGHIDAQQMEWIKQDLATITPSTPVVISTHIPLLSLYTYVFSGNMAQNDSATVVINAREVLDLFKGYNLRLVLQGHQHFYEDITYQIDNQTIRFITGGAVCASWWGGPERGLQEGFLKVDIKGSEIETQYIDYEWDAVKSK